MTLRSEFIRFAHTFYLNILAGRFLAVENSDCLSELDIHFYLWPRKCRFIVDIKDLAGIIREKMA